MDNDQAPNETRKAIHDLRDTIYDWQLESQRQRMEADKIIAIVQTELKAFNERMANVVHRNEFAPVKLLVYGMTATVMSGAAGAVLAKIFIK